jgi:hypothetical protein
VVRGLPSKAPAARLRDFGGKDIVRTRSCIRWPKSSTSVDARPGDLTLQSMQFEIEEYLPRLRSYSEESVHRVSPMTAN